MKKYLDSAQYRHNIFIPILIVIVIILLILSFWILFLNKKKPENGNGLITVPAQIITPGTETEKGNDLINEFNSAPRVEYKYTLANGEDYIIKIPVGIDPPPQAVVEKMYRMEKGE